MSSLYRYLIPLVAFIAITIAVYFTGYEKGKSMAEKAYLNLQLSSIEQMLVKNTAQIKQAQEFNKNLELLLSNQNEQNLTTTKEIRDALKKTAASRVHCELPANVMQQLDTARRRAANATTTRHINNQLPTTDGRRG